MPSLIFHDLTITGAGELLSRRTHDASALAPEAVAVFRRMLDADPWHFDRSIPHTAFAHVRLKWTRERAHPGVALATFGVGDRPYTTSALLAGGDREQERTALRLVQDLVRRTPRAAGGESVAAGYDLIGVAERPVLATVVLAGAVPGDDLAVIADMETCLAAAFFASPRDLLSRPARPCV